MATFRLSQLPPILLEKVFSKFDKKSYFRLRQTCRGAEEFARASRNIRIHVNRMLYPYWSKDESRLKFNVVVGKGLANRTTYRRGQRRRSYDVADLYGCRLDRLHFYDASIETNFDDYCTVLKKSRVTCKDMVIPVVTGLTKEQLVALFNILKPVRIFVNVQRSDRLEAFLEVKGGLEEVSLHLDLDDILKNDLFVMKKILSQFHVVHFFVERATHSMDELFGFLKTVLKFLRSAHLPNLHSFRILGLFKEHVPMATLLPQLVILRDFNPAEMPSRSRTRPIWIKNYTFGLGQNGICEFGINRKMAEIFYREADEWQFDSYQ